MTLAHTLVEKGVLPDALVRQGIRRRLADRIEREMAGGVEARQERTRALVEELRRSPIALATDKANEQHYEAPTAFFRMALGARMKYSCAHWPEDVRTLDAAEESMLALCCERARIEDGMEVLDLGCGWGSMGLWIAEKYPRCRVLGVSNSATQRAFIEERRRELGLKNIEILTRDANELTLDRTFNRVVSIEMFEHVRNYQSLLERIAGWLRPEGLLFVHIFTHHTCAYPFNEEDDWIGKWFFTGGLMPSNDLLLRFQRDVELLDQWLVDGRHYEKTANAWLARMDQRREEVRLIFREHYGEAEAEAWTHRWRVFFMACAELWGFQGGQEWMVSHFLFRPRGR